ncbi:MAG: hypothetical protein HUU46_02540 [Candidatus Hydrogenedentes bacterium]|nr:hypothetical protein [Candidatus Hydrogenedentota bacterium]
MKDPIVEEVRKHRMEHTLKFGGDLRAICEDLRRIQKASGHKVVRLRARRVSDQQELKPKRKKDSSR